MVDGRLLVVGYELSLAVFVVKTPNRSVIHTCVIVPLSYVCLPHFYLGD